MSHFSPVSPTCWVCIYDLCNIDLQVSNRIDQIQIAEKSGVCVCVCVCVCVSA